MTIPQPTNGSSRLAKSLLVAGGLCWALPIVLLALSPVVGTLGGWAGVMAMAVLWPIGTLLFLIGFVLLVVRGKAGAAYEDRPGNS